MARCSSYRRGWEQYRGFVPAVPLSQSAQTHPIACPPQTCCLPCHRCPIESPATLWGHPDSPEESAEPGDGTKDPSGEGVLQVQSCYFWPLPKLRSRRALGRAGMWQSWDVTAPGGERGNLVQQLLCSAQPPDSSCFFISSLFPDKPLWERCSRKQLQQVPLAGGVWQAGSKIQPPHQSSSHSNEGKRKTHLGGLGSWIPFNPQRIKDEELKEEAKERGGSCS